MTTHSDRYRQLRNNPALTDTLRHYETAAAQNPIAIVPKQAVAAIDTTIPEGAIIAIATTIDGLDYAHIGFAIRIDGRTHLLHASSSRRCVCISAEPLADYLRSVSHFSGISIVVPSR